MKGAQVSLLFQIWTNSARTPLRLNKVNISSSLCVQRVIYHAHATLDFFFHSVHKHCKRARSTPFKPLWRRAALQASLKAVVCPNGNHFMFNDMTPISERLILRRNVLLLYYRCWPVSAIRLHFTLVAPFCRRTSHQESSFPLVCHCSVLIVKVNFSLFQPSFNSKFSR